VSTELWPVQSAERRGARCGRIHRTIPVRKGACWGRAGPRWWPRGYRGRCERRLGRARRESCRPTWAYGWCLPWQLNLCCT